MVKRIYWNTIKSWALKVGLPVGTAGFAVLFIYLSALGVIDVTSYSGDSICAGTIEDPCEAFIDFSVSEDIFIYPVGYDPWGRDTPFYTDEGLESWKMYRSWGKGWREIKLNETCTGTWCGAPNNKGVKYSFVFRKGRDYQIKIVAYKSNPNQVIKWGFGPVDPTWYSLSSRNYIDGLRNEGMNKFRDGDNLFSYNPSTKRIVIEDLDGNLLLKMSLESEYAVPGLIASSDTKVADFNAKDWGENQTKIVDIIEFYDVNDNYKRVNKSYGFKWKNETRTCYPISSTNGTTEICDTKLEWIEFGSLDELPYKNINFSLWVNTNPGEKIEWVPIIEGFKIFQWAEWDISTATIGGNYSVATQDALSAGLHVKPDGSAWFMSGFIGDDLNEYSMTDGIINTSSPVRTQSLSVINPSGIHFNTAGTNLISSSSASKNVSQFTLDVWDITTLTITGSTVLDDASMVDLENVQIFADGYKLIGCDSPANFVIYNLSVQNDITSKISPALRWDGVTEGGQTSCRGFHLNDDGDRFYYTGSTDKVDQFTLSTPNLFTTTTYIQSLTVNPPMTNPYDMDFNDLGTFMYILDIDLDRVVQYHIESAPDLVPPNVTINQPINKSYNTATISFNVTVLDTVGVANVSYSLDGGTTNISMTNASTSINDYNATATSIPEGSNTVIFYGRDTLNNLNDSEEVTFNVDLTNPDISIVFPQNNSNSTNVNINVNYTASDLNLFNCWYSNDSMQKNYSLANCGTNITTIVWSEGLHNVTVWANDTAGNLNDSKISFRIDTTAPVTTAVATSPPGGASYTFNTWSDENVKVTMSSVDGGVGFDAAIFPKYCTDTDNTCDPNTFISSGVTISTEDVSYIRYNATDRLGNSEAINSQIIKIDSIDPLISIVFPINNTNWTNINLNVNYIRSDTNLAYCWYSNDSYSVNSTPDSTCNNITGVVWSEGQHNVTIWANDSANRESFSRISFTIDLTNPDINITFPINNSNHTDVTLDVEFTRSDANLFNCWYSNDSYSVNITLANCNNITDVIWSFAKHNVTVWANDSAGNLNNSKITFNIYKVEQNILYREVELGTNVNILANTTLGGGVICVDIDHPEYGINYSCLSDVNISFNISYFRITTLSNGSSSILLNYSNPVYFNVSFINITSHQYAEVINLSLNISGIGKPRDVTFYKVNTTDFDRVYMGYLIGNEIYLNKSCDGSGNGVCAGYNNLSFSNPGSQTIYFYIDDNIKVFNFTLNVSGSLYGFEYEDLFDNDTYIDWSETTGQLDLSGVIMPANSSYKEFSYDDFEDGTIDVDAVWSKISDFSYTATCVYSGATTEANGVLKQFLTWSDVGDVCTGTISLDLWSNETALNMYTTDEIEINLSNAYYGEEGRCSGNTKVYAGNVLIWTSVEQGGSADVIEESVSKRMKFEFTKANTTSWRYQISGEEHADAFLSPNQIDIYYNWTNGTWKRNIGGSWTNGVLINDSYFSPDYAQDAIKIRSEFTDSGECASGSQNTYVSYVNNSKWKRTNGSVTSNSIFDSEGNIEDATLSGWGYTNPGEVIVPYLSADGGTTWEAVTWQTKHNFAVPGKHLKWRINFTNVAVRYENRSSYVTRITVNTTQSNPSNITLDFGDDKVTNITIRGMINSTNGTFTLDLSNQNITDSFTSLRVSYDHVYVIPLTVYSDSKGYVNLNFFNLTYNPNPIRLNKTSVQNFLGNSSEIINFTIPIGTYSGNITIDDIKFDYSGGNDTINITVHSPNYLGFLNQTNITLWRSSFFYNLPYTWVDVIFFLPRTNNSKNVSAYGQTANIPIYNFTTTNYGGRNMNLSMRLNESSSCLNVTWNATGNNKPIGYVLNTSWQEIIGDLEYLNNTKVWFWADLDNCDASDNWALQPEVQIEGYCKECRWM